MGIMGSKIIFSLLSITLLLGTSGIGIPAFAEPQITQSDSTPLTSSQVAEILTAHNIVFDNGGAPDATAGFTLVNTQSIAEDFIIDTDTFVTDFHFVSIGNPTDIVHTIYADAGGVPGAVLASGSPQNLVISQIGTSPFFEVWFDLEDPFLAEAGVKYWFGLHSTNSFGDGSWVFSNSGGFESKTAISISPGVWDISGADSWFLLSGNSPVVGGELIPLDTTSLLLAGTQMNAAWMIPVIVSAIGIGIVIARKF